MGSRKPEVYKLPQQQQTQQANTFAPISIANTPEAQALQNVDLDFGSPINVDPGIQRRTDLRKQATENEANSVFNSGVPRMFRMRALESDLRDIDAQGAYESQQANFLNQQGNNALRAARTQAELERKRINLPGVYQTGGSGMSTGFTSQLGQDQPGFLQRLALGAVGGAASLPKFGFGG